MLNAIGEHHPAQFPATGFATSAYAKCSDDAIYFAGPTRTKLVAVSARDGKLLWQYPQGEFQLVLRDNTLYALGANQPSQKFNPLTGEVLGSLPNRRAVRGPLALWIASLSAAAAMDVLLGHVLGEAVSAVAHASGLPRRRHRRGRTTVLGPVDVRLQLVLDRHRLPGTGWRLRLLAAPTEDQRLEVLAKDPAEVAPGKQTANDWPTYRSDNQRARARRGAFRSKPSNTGSIGPRRPTSVRHR